jgi:hypothetical protein
MHALSLAQSEFIVHSGLQFGGDPMYVSMQEHIGTLLVTWHSELGPHGDGIHGLISGVGKSKITEKKCRKEKTWAYKLSINNLINLYLLIIAAHLMKGSPWKPWRQLHIGAWFTVLHSAFSPHTPIQALTHFWLTQLFVASHSELIVHSGRQLGGEPKKSGIQEHVAWSLWFLQIELLPHGFGTHGFWGEGTVTNKRSFVNN